LPVKVSASRTDPTAMTPAARANHFFISARLSSVS
jgi:hypothetical protein